MLHDHHSGIQPLEQELADVQRCAFCPSAAHDSRCLALSSGCLEVCMCMLAGLEAVPPDAAVAC